MGSVRFQPPIVQGLQQAKWKPLAPGKVVEGGLELTDAGDSKIPPSSAQARVDSIRFASGVKYFSVDAKTSSFWPIFACNWKR